LFASFTDEKMVHQVTDSDDFNNQLAAAPKGTLVLVNFRTNWAGACKVVAKMLKEMEESGNDGTSDKSNLRVLEVMVEDCGDLAANFAIPAMPAVFVFADGEVKAELIGKTEVRDKLVQAVEGAATEMK
jgi:thioredoxin-like negative regulator of GroEL